MSSSGPSPRPWLRALVAGGALLLIAFAMGALALNPPPPDPRGIVNVVLAVLFAGGGVLAVRWGLRLRREGRAKAD